MLSLPLIVVLIAAIPMFFIMKEVWKDGDRKYSKVIKPYKVYSFIRVPKTFRFKLVSEIINIETLVEDPDGKYHGNGNKILSIN